MIWQILLGALVLHVLCAALILRDQARRICNWRISLLSALGGQLAISIAGLAAGILCVLAGGELGLPTTGGLYFLGAFAAAIAWGVALTRLVAWLAQNAKGGFYSPATMRRISTRSFFHVLACYGGAAVVGLGAWRGSHPPAGSPGAAGKIEQHI